MSKWDESRVRKEASWQAFKEGKSLFDRARVEGFKLNGELATAVFRAGKRKLRTVVRMGAQLEVDCQCPANRSSGEICPHGVAVALAAFGEGGIRNEDRPVEAVEVDAPIMACRVVFPPGYERGLQAGCLGVSIEACEEVPTSSDRPLSEWLAKHAPNSRLPLLVTLQGEDTPALLEAVAGHARLFTKGGDVLSIPEGGMDPVRVVNSSLRNGRVRIDVETGLTPIRWGRGLGWINGASLGRAPAEGASIHWRDEAIDLLAEGYLDLPSNEFFSEIDAWMNLLQAPYEGWLQEIRFESKAAQLRVELEGSLNALDLRLFEDSMGAPEIAEDGITVQTPDREAYTSLLHRLIDWGFRIADQTMTLRDHDLIVRFLADGVPEMEKSATVIIGSRLQHVRKSLHVIRPKFDFGSGGSLSCEISFQTDGGKVIPRAKVLKILRSGKPGVKTRNGAEVVVSQAIPDQIEPLLADLGVVRPEGQLQLSRAQHECLQRASNPDAELSIPKVIPQVVGEATLRDYQQHGANWILDRWKHFGGALLADEMGLGKTLQTIAALGQLKRANDLGACLILVPTSLLTNWEIELQRFAPELGVVRLHGNKRDELRDPAGKSDVVLTSYGTLARDLAFHLKQKYRTVVADEASLLRNPDSEISRTVAKLAPERRLALTGTPVENRLQDLWSIFRSVAPGYLGPKDEFLARYEQGDATEAVRLKTRIAPFMLRRTKSEVAKDLPARNEIDQWLDLTPDARALYREVAQAGLSQSEELEEAGNLGAASMHLLTTLLRLRQICLDTRLVGDAKEAQSSRKFDWLEAFLEERNATDRKTLVFSQFAGFLRIAEERLSGGRSKVFRLDGQTRNRGDLVHAFQTHVGPAVFLISLKAGGYGLNLTAADAVVHMDPWWNPAAEAQASDRAHRIGQTRPVTVYRLLIKNSVEERVQRLQRAKQTIITQMNDGDPPEGWGREDLAGLLAE